MKIDVNSVVTLHYKLSNNLTGDHIEETKEDAPMEFLYGIERVIPKFEESIFGLSAGESFEFDIPSAEAYGELSADHIAELPISIFQEKDGKIDEKFIFEGAVVPMRDNEGNSLHGKVLQITNEIVKMDFNHPLAGIDLRFKGQILTVRSATADEISHGHSHGAHGHHH